MTYHPDRNGGDNSTAEKFREVTDAYNVLVDKGLRAAHDRELGPSGSSNNPNFSWNMKGNHNTWRAPSNAGYDHPSRGKVYTKAPPPGTKIFDDETWRAEHYGDIRPNQQFFGNTFTSTAFQNMKNPNFAKASGGANFTGSVGNGGNAAGGVEYLGKEHNSTGMRERTITDVKSDIVNRMDLRKKNRRPKEENSPPCTIS